MRTSIFDYNFTRFSVFRSITDAMYQWDMDVAMDYPVPQTWDTVEAVIGDDCVLVGFPISKKEGRNKNERFTSISGFSYGWYPANRPIRPENRLLKSHVSGNEIIVEDPLLHLDRIIHGTDNPCGLVKGGWDSGISGWGTATRPYQQFESSDTSYVQNVIDDVCENTGVLYLDGWRKINNIWTPCTYLRSESALDTGFDLPAPIFIQASTSQEDIRNHRVMIEAEAEINGDKWKNSIWVDGVIQGTLTGYSARKPAVWDVATMGPERPYQYCFTMPPTVTVAQAQTLVAEKTNLLYALLTIPAETFSVKFWDRSDLKLMQKIEFSGFSTIPNGPMRIVEIRYDIDRDNGCVCTCSCAVERSWSAIRKLAISMKQDWAAISDSIKRSVQSSTKQVVYGTVVANGPSGTAIVQSPGSGALAYSSMPNQ